jgi:hypothetical protein
VFWIDTVAPMPAPWLRSDLTVSASPAAAATMSRVSPCVSRAFKLMDGELPCAHAPGTKRANDRTMIVNPAYGRRRHALTGRIDELRVRIFSPPLHTDLALSKQL